jgi:hypothetical protein
MKLVQSGIKKLCNILAFDRQNQREIMDFMTSENATGTVKFTRFDRNAWIYSGTFQFSGIDKRTGKRITLTEGRFDYKKKR